MKYIKFNYIPILCIGIIIFLLNIYYLSYGNIFENFEKQPYKVSVIGIFKNETMNLKLWLDHYLWQGVEHFYLIDNGSDDNPDKILEPYILQGIVSLYKFPEKYKQVEHYKTVWNKENIPSKTKWLIMADLDEFWYAPNSKLSIIIDDYEEYDIIYSNWYMFGSDGWNEHPKDIRKDIIYRKHDFPNETKWICKTNNVDVSNLWIHSFRNDDNLKKITENEKIHLNHYPIQSKEFFEKVKMTRGDVGTILSKDVRDWTYFNDYDKDNTYMDTVLKNMITNT
jgi:hypothetical protein